MENMEAKQATEIIRQVLKATQDFAIDDNMKAAALSNYVTSHSKI